MKLRIAVVLSAIVGIASPLRGVTCTLDQRPAATLLVPWFQVTFNADGSPQTVTNELGPAFDTLVTIGNASSAPTLVHVCLFNERSVPVLDFNIALTGFDVQAMRMSEILRGNLPSTPVTTSHQSSFEEACQRNSRAPVYRDGGFLRVFPQSPALPEDNPVAGALYPTPAFSQGGIFELQTLDSLDVTSDSLGCPEPIDHVILGVIHGYLTADMVNYCSLSNPTDPKYYANDVIGMENNLWGEVIYTSSTGVPTYGGSAVAIEADRSFSNLANGGQFDQTAVTRTRTYYARYWSPATEIFCTNCGSGDYHTDLGLDAPWDRGFGDEREPLGLSYAVRYFQGAGVATNWIVWRASSGDLTGGSCTAVEPDQSILFFDEDENSSLVSTIPLPSPIPPPPEFTDIPLETQKMSVSFFPRPPGAVGGWASIEFGNRFVGTVLDQAFVSYELIGASSFLTVAGPGTALDPSSCNPLGVPIGAFPGGVNGPVSPVIPGGIFPSGVNNPNGTGPPQ